MANSKTFPLGEDEITVGELGLAEVRKLRAQIVVMDAMRKAMGPENWLPTDDQFDALLEIVKAATRGASATEVAERIGRASLMTAISVLLGAAIFAVFGAGDDGSGATTARASGSGEA